MRSHPLPQNSFWKMVPTLAASNDWMTEGSLRQERDGIATTVLPAIAMARMLETAKRILIWAWVEDCDCVEVYSSAVQFGRWRVAWLNKKRIWGLDVQIGGNGQQFIPWSYLFIYLAPVSPNNFSEAWVDPRPSFQAHWGIICIQAVRRSMIAAHNVFSQLAGNLQFHKLETGISLFSWGLLTRETREVATLLDSPKG